MGSQRNVRYGCGVHTVGSSHVTNPLVELTPLQGGSQLVHK